MEESGKFNINLEKIDGINCLYLDGYLDAYTAPELENSLAELVKSGEKDILVNFSRLEYISSAGLGVFMAFIEDLRDKGGDIKLTEMKQKVYSVFDLLGFPMLFNIEKRQETSLKNFSNNKANE